MTTIISSSNIISEIHSAFKTVPKKITDFAIDDLIEKLERTKQKLIEDGINASSDEKIFLHADVYNDCDTLLSLLQEVKESRALKEKESELEEPERE